MRLVDEQEMVLGEVVEQAVRPRAGGVAGGCALACAEPSEGLQVAYGTTRVGRWMSREELAKMQRSGKVQAGGGGQTRVAHPAHPNAYRNPPAGDVYVEFDVPTYRLKPHSQGTSRIPGPLSPDARAAARAGQDASGFAMPPATNIHVFDGRWSYEEFTTRVV